MERRGLITNLRFFISVKSFYYFISVNITKCSYLVKTERGEAKDLIKLC